uniref:CSON012359 protein n=1 Tax=Culicoides sonorensis TaxID=179676 RepID=A0A336MHD8_CULSO
MEQILEFIKYDDYKWDIVVDFKLINILCGLMGAASKFAIGMENTKNQTNTQKRNGHHGKLGVNQQRWPGENIIPGLSTAKLQAGVYNGQQIRTAEYQAFVCLKGFKLYFCLVGSLTSPVYDMAASTTPPALPAASIPNIRFGR